MSEIIDLLTKTVNNIHTEKDKNIFIYFIKWSLDDAFRRYALKIWLIQRQAYFGWNGIYDIKVRETDLSRTKEE